MQRRAGRWRCAGAAVLLLLIAPAVEAATSSGCRAGVARSLRRMTHTAFATIDACHAQLNVGKDVGPCNDLPSSSATPWGRRVSRTGSVVNFKCAADDMVVRENYPACAPAPCDNITSALVTGSESLIETAANALLDDAAPTSLAVARCRDVILAAQRRIALRVLTRSQDCQARLDRKDGLFGPLSEQCMKRAAAVAERGGAKIARVCGTLTGTDVGSCEPLPECVTEQAQTLGLDLAELTYGQPASCGDGEVDPLEECDDGNDVATDECTDTCRSAVCGDGITWEGVEECDDANPFANDFCDACRLPVCGDGIEAGDEECDDGNQIPDDGCTECIIDSVPCGAGGLRATVTFVDTQNAAAGRMLLAYPGEVSLPGTGAAGTVRQRVTNLSATSNPIFLPSDQDTDGDTIDDTLVLVFGTATPWPAGPMAAISFDCPAGTPVRAPDFGCSFNDASDAFSNALDPATLVCRVTALEPIQ
jgi:cysteine-rich repeat protein